jgi:methylmalonyl-CoA mutase
VKQSRDSKAVESILNRLREAAKTGNENLLGLSVEAAKARATVGEISKALEDVFGRHVPKENIVRGAYSKEAMTKSGDKGKNEFEAALDVVKSFAKKEGRNPRILVAKMGQDGHDRGAKVIASGFADLGYDVDVGGLFQTPEEVARQAIDNDVHVVGVSSLAAGHKTLVPALKQALKKQGGDHIVLICGGVIPQGDYEFLLQNGASMVFGPGTKVTDASVEVVKLLEKRKAK